MRLGAMRHVAMRLLVFLLFGACNRRLLIAFTNLPLSPQRCATALDGRQLSAPDREGPAPEAEILRSLDIAPGSSFLGFHDIGILVTADGHDGYFADGVGSFDHPVSVLHVLRLVENVHSLGRVATVRLALLSAGVGVRPALGGAGEPIPFSMPKWPIFGNPTSGALCAGGSLPTRHCQMGWRPQ